jgi:transcription termination factor 2
MEDTRLPKVVFYSELKEGRRSTGGQKLRYKDVLKRHMKNARVPSESWEEKAQNRREWKAIVRAATSSIEEKRQAEYLKAHQRRHTVITTSDFICTNCQRRCRSRAGLAAHARACQS